MDMRRVLSVFLVALTAISCTKEFNDPVAEEQKPALDVTFTATTGEDAPSGSKSYIGKTTESSSILYWSPYDCLGVYSYTAPIGDAGCQLSCGAKCALKSRNENVADFDGKNGSWNSATSDKYYFYAYYPELSGSVKAESAGVLSGFSVPSFQIKHFGNYHICSTNQPAEITAASLESSANIQMSFAPRTALFSIKVYIDDANTLEEVKLSRVKVTFNGTDSNGKQVNVTGDCTLSLKDGALTCTGNGSNVVTVSMNDYYTAESIATAKKKAEGVKTASFDMVLLPVSGFNGTVSFDFMTTESAISIPSVERSIEGKSFISGKRYESTLTISPVKGEETANCYIVDATSTTSINLPIMQGAWGWSEIDKYNKTTGSSTQVFEEWFWDALDGEVIGKVLWSEKGTVTATCKREGNFLKVDLSGASNGDNAVIALKDAEGKVLWSWHLWFTDYKPDETPDENMKVTGGYVHKYQGTEWADGGIYAGKYMMDRNLGFTKTGFISPGLPGSPADQTYSGLYYQYGRKDPFRTGNFTTAQGHVTMDQGALNPTVFYYRTDGFDWVTNTDHLNTDPWAGLSETALPKSAFDPCPKGWRVPVAYRNLDAKGNVTAEVNTWSGFKGNVSGTSGTVAAFVQRGSGFYYRGTASGYGGSTPYNATYPTTGRLSYKDGTLGVTNEVNLWSASPQPASVSQQHNARYFSADVNASGASNGLDTQINAISRAAGMPVRCVKE